MLPHWRSIEAYQETGRLLLTQKEKMSHGEWLPWVKANETVLGFGVLTAQRLMKWASDPALDVESVWGNASLTKHLPDLEPDPDPGIRIPAKDSPYKKDRDAWDDAEDETDSVDAEPSNPTDRKAAQRGRRWFPSESFCIPD